MKIEVNPHILDHIESQQFNNGSSLSLDALQEVLEISKNRINKEIFDKHPLIANQMLYICVKNKDIKYTAGQNRLKEDKNVHAIWELEFELMNSTLCEFGQKESSNANPDYLWMRRNYSEYPVLMDTVTKSIPAKQVNVIVEKVSDDHYNIVTIYPGQLAPPISFEYIYFWKEHSLNMN